MTLKTIVAAAALTLSVGTADAAVVWEFEETGGDVVGTLTGSLDLTGATFFGNGTTVGSGTIPQAGAMLVGGAPGTTSDVYTISGPASFGAGLFTAPTSFTGNLFGIVALSDWLIVEDGYQSGDAISGSVTFTGANYASLGINAGTYVYSLPNDTVTLIFNPAVIPLPAGLPLLLAGLGAFGLVRRRRHNA